MVFLFLLLRTVRYALDIGFLCDENNIVVGMYCYSWMGW